MEIGGRTLIDRRVFPILARCGFVDTSGEVHLPVYSNLDENVEAKREPWELQDLPRVLLQGDYFGDAPANQNVRRELWEKVIQPFFRSRVESGLPPQNLEGNWQLDIFKAWDGMYKEYLGKRGTRIKELGTSDGSYYHSRAVFPQGDDRIEDRNS